MKRFIQQFHKESHKITLTARERDELLSRIEAYMEYHPLPATVKKSQEISLVSSLRVTEPMRLVRIPRRFLVAFSTATTMFMLVVVPAMAEQSMPGNMLHPIKVHVNEEIRGYFLSGEERVRWETERVERRLAEARRLAILGRLTPEIEARVAEAVTRQKDVARNQIATLETSDGDAATMATLALASVFEVQETLLESVRPTLDDVPGQLSSIIETGKEETKARGSVAIVSEARLLAMIEQHATRAYELLLGLQKTIDDTERELILKRLENVETTLADYTGGVYVSEEERLAGLRDVWGDLQKLISYMNSLHDKTPVALDQVVPIRLTYEERVAKLRDEETNLRLRLERIEKASAVDLTLPVFEKFLFVAPVMQEQLSLIPTVNPGNIRILEQKVIEIRGQLDAIEKSVPADILLDIDSQRETVPATMEQLDAGEGGNSTSTEAAIR